MRRTIFNDASELTRVWTAHISVWREASYLLAAGRYGLSIFEAHGNLPMVHDDPRRDRVNQHIATLRDALKLDVIIDERVRPEIDHALSQVLEDSANVALAMFGQSDEWHAEWKSDIPGHLCFPKIVITCKGKQVLSLRAEVELCWWEEGNERGFWYEAGKQHLDQYGINRFAVCHGY
jgi:hypothetical protein